MIPKSHDNYSSIEHFFKMNLGNWRTQKTSYNPNSKKHTTSTTETSVKEVNKESITQKNFGGKELKAPVSLGKTSLYNIRSKVGNNHIFSIITYRNEQQISDHSHGTLSKFYNNEDESSFKGEFKIVKGVFKTLIQNEELKIEETIWFINENFKLTKSIIKKDNHCILISFASDIKIHSKT